MLFNINKVFEKIEGENFTFEIKFRNIEKIGVDASRKVRFTTLFEDGFIETSFVMPGFKSRIILYYGEVIRNGILFPLDKFETDLSQWHVMRCVVVDKNVSIFLDDQLIQEDRFKKHLGKMAGLSFKGYAEIESIKLWNQQNKLVYDENHGR